jgi:threonine dehydratase
VLHQRLFAAPSVQAAQLEVMFEARDAAHGAEIVRTLEQIYTVRQI